MPHFTRFQAEPTSDSGPGGRWFESNRPDQSFQSLNLVFDAYHLVAVDDFVDTPNHANGLARVP